MHRLMLMVFVLLFLLCQSPLRAEEVYEYTDKNGTVWFTDKIDEIPPEYRDQVNSRDMPVRTQKSESKSNFKPQERETSAKEEPKNKYYKEGNPEIVIYSTSWCGYCKKTKKLIDQMGFNFTEKDIEKDRSAFREMTEMSGSKSVPVITIDGQLIKGYNPAKIRAYLSRYKR